VNSGISIDFAALERAGNLLELSTMEKEAPDRRDAG